MNAQAILKSLQEGRIDLEEAKLRLGENSGQTRRDSIGSERNQPLRGADQPVKPHPSVRSDAIAIIGMSGQFPKADTLEQFWANLAEGRDCISEVPKGRWNMESYFDNDPKAPGKSYSKWMGVLEAADQFDPQFFNLSPAEAELMDPQQRLFLEHCWRSLEDAGVAPSSIAGTRCGVFAGCSVNDYGQLMGSEGMSAFGLVGRSISILPARISYLLNLKGPCLAIDTSCSASLVAIAEACNSLKLGDSDLALAGGVCVLATPAMHIMTSKAGMLSPDGRCFTFDNRANGFVPGEGVGVVVLKRLADAERDQDLIYGVIRGWGMNQDGRTNGITAPSSQSQADLERDVYQRFHIHPESISMVEAHGTGTRLGDPIEVEALTASFQAFTQKKGYCALGSVKSNIGHLLTAAGAAGVIKVLLSMKHKMLPPTIHFESLNDHISLDQSPFYINAQLRPWEADSSAPRRAAVSSFGFSGTNAHLVIEEYASSLLQDSFSASGQAIHDGQHALSPDANAARNLYAVPLSSPDAAGLARSAAQLIDWIGKEEHTKEGFLSALAFTLQTGREQMKERAVIFADHAQNLLLGLRELNQTGNRISRVITKLDHPPLTYGNTRFVDSGHAWVKGGTVEWQSLYTNDEACPSRLRLPSFPFQKERYWARYGASEPVSHDSDVPFGPTESIDARSYVYELLARHNLGTSSSTSETLFDETLPFIQLGLDSLVAIHMQNTIMKDFGIEITMTQLMDGLNASELIKQLEALQDQATGRQENDALTAGHARMRETRWQSIEDGQRLDPSTPLQEEAAGVSRASDQQSKAVWMEL